MGRVLFLLFATVALIVFEYSRRKNIKKSLLSFAILMYLFVVGYSGTILMRAALPLYFIHLIAVIIGYITLLWYLWSGRLFWYLFIIPLATIALYVGLNFLEGSRYEAFSPFITYV